jgi:hypothetical protein
MRPHLENAHHKKHAGGVAPSVGTEFKSQYYQKKSLIQQSMSDFFVQQLLGLLQIFVIQVNSTFLYPADQTGNISLYHHSYIIPDEHLLFLQNKSHLLFSIIITTTSVRQHPSLGLGQQNP